MFSQLPHYLFVKVCSLGSEYLTPCFSRKVIKKKQKGFTLVIFFLSYFNCLVFLPLPTY